VAQIAEFGPSARGFAAIASIDAGNLVLYGGQSSSQLGAALLADTWQFDGTLWTDRQDIGPGPLASAAATFDSARQKVILFGGVGSAATESGLTWETVVTPVPSPIRVVSLAFPPNVAALPVVGIFPQFVVTLSGPAPAGGSRVNVTGGPIFGFSIDIGQNVKVNVSPLQAVTVPVGSIAVSTVFAVPLGSAGTQMSVSAEIPGTPAVSASFHVD
jgi:hypothetical protein